MLKKTLLALFLVLAPTFSQIVVINSKDWKDVYSGILYAHYMGYPVYFATSPNPQGLFNILPKRDIILIESNNPMVSNLESQLRTRGYNIIRTIRVRNANIELIPLVVDKFVVVEEDFPYLSIPAAPLARAMNGWVIIVSDNNLNDVVRILSNASEVILVGVFKRNIYNAISPYATKVIEGTSKYKLSLDIAEEFMKIKKVKTALISEGKYIEPQLLYGASPVLLTGTNYLPEGLIEFLERHGIKSVTVIGPQLTYIGEQIREKTNKGVSVYVKFGMSTPGISPRIYAIAMFPLPTPNLNLTVNDTVYNPKEKKLYINFRNLGNVGLFSFTTFRVIDENGNEIASGGDEEPLFIGAGESLWKGYDVNIPPPYENKTIELYVSYGESPENMMSYLTERGRFGPPLSLPLKVSEIEDKSELEIVDVRYNTLRDRFEIFVKNLGNVKAYGIVKLKDVSVGGIKKSFSSEVFDVAPGEERRIIVKESLDEYDLEENKIVKLELDYGENPDSLIKYKVYEMELKIHKGIPMIIILAPVPVIAIVIFLFLKKIL